MISKKITLIGDFSTGKTSLIRRFVDNQFSDKYLSTLGVKISKKLIKLDDTSIQGLIWDIEGGTKTKPLNETYLRGMHGSIIVADITRDDTIDNISNYIEIAKSVSLQIPYVVALNKSDKLDSSVNETIKSDLISRLDISEQQVYLTSAKTGEGVEEMFVSLAKNILNKRD